MDALEDRRQAAREAFADEFVKADGLTSRAVDDAIETATRVRITDEVVQIAQGDWPQMTPNGWLKEALKRAFRAAGFEVES